MDSTVLISLIGIIVALVFVNYSVYKGFNLPMACIVSGVIIWVTSGIGIEAGYTEAADTFGPLMGTMAPIFIFGSILGLILSESGAAASLGLALFKPFKNVQDPNVKRVGTLLMFFFLRVLLGLSGIDNMAVIPTMVALVTVMFMELDMPRKYCNACLMVAGTIATFMPQVPSMLNIIVPMFVPGFTASSLALPRWIFCIVFIVGASLWLNALISKEIANGAHFELGGGMNVGDLHDESVKRPFWVLTLIPILVIFFLYNYGGMAAWSSLAVGTIVAGVMFFPFIKAKEGESKFGHMVGLVNQGTLLVPLYYNMTYIPAVAMLASTGYAYLTSTVFTAIATSMPLALGFSIISVILVPVGSSALMVNASIANDIFVPLGLSAGTAGMLLIVANTVFDSLPNSPGMIMQADLTATPMKECYPAIFKTTVILTGAIMVVACALAVIGLY